MAIVEAVPAFRDNYIWTIHDGRSAVLVDPGEAGPILAWLNTHKLIPVGILITHHHGDHIGGLPDLLSRWHLPVFGPAGGGIPGVDHPVSEGDRAALPELGLSFTVLETPGHTLDHVCYLGHGLMFSGDTLFSCGCGRLFEGSPEQMHASLERLASLPGDTLVYCAHEYTLANIAFALEADPENARLRARHQQALAARRAGKPTLPTTIAQEKLTNPFLRSQEPALLVAASQHAGQKLSPGLAVFSALRSWKNDFH